MARLASLLSTVDLPITILGLTGAKYKHAVLNSGQDKNVPYILSAVLLHESLPSCFSLSIANIAKAAVHPTEWQANQTAVRNRMSKSRFPTRRLLPQRASPTRPAITEGKMAEHTTPSGTGVRCLTTNCTPRTHSSLTRTANHQHIPTQTTSKKTTDSVRNRSIFPVAVG